MKLGFWVQRKTQIEAASERCAEESFCTCEQCQKKTATIQVRKDAGSMPSKFEEIRSYSFITCCSAMVPYVRHAEKQLWQRNRFTRGTYYFSILVDMYEKKRTGRRPNKGTVLPRSAGVPTAHGSAFSVGWGTTLLHRAVMMSVSEAFPKPRRKTNLLNYCYIDMTDRTVRGWIGI